MLRQNTTPQYNNTTVQTQRFNNYNHATHATHYKPATPCNTIQHHSADDNTHTRQRPELRHHPCCCSCGAVRRRCPGRSPAAPCCVRHVLCKAVRQGFAKAERWESAAASACARHVRQTPPPRQARAPPPLRAKIAGLQHNAGEVQAQLTIDISAMGARAHHSHAMHAAV